MRTYIRRACSQEAAQLGSLKSQVAELRQQMGQLSAQLSESRGENAHLREAHAKELSALQETHAQALGEHVRQIADLKIECESLAIAMHGMIQEKYGQSLLKDGAGIRAREADPSQMGAGSAEVVAVKKPNPDSLKAGPAEQGLEMPPTDQLQASAVSHAVQNKRPSSRSKWINRTAASHPGSHWVLGGPNLSVVSDAGLVHSMTSIDVSKWLKQAARHAQEWKGIPSTASLTPAELENEQSTPDPAPDPLRQLLFLDQEDGGGRSPKASRWCSLGVCSR